MKKAVLGVGVPGAGKSTILKKFASKHGYVYICPDEIRAEVCGDAADQSKNREVWDLTRNRAGSALREGNSVVVDATFANPDDRQRFIAHLRKSGAEKIQGVFFDTPPEIAKERNLSRERVVPEKVINFMQRSLRDSPPNTFGEFDSLFTLDENAELTAVEKTDRREGFRQIKLR